MKVGLKAHYTKTGELAQKVSTNPPSQYVDTSANQVQHDHDGQKPAFDLKEDLKTGLRAWYKKRGKLNETTMQPSVGVTPERSLGGWGAGLPSKRKKRPTEKNGDSLRGSIQSLERSLENTLATLSSAQGVSESDKSSFLNLLADALSDVFQTGSLDKLTTVKMKATLIESSAFIGEPAHETPTVLTPSNDKGRLFVEKMGEQHGGAIVEMVSTQLSSGTPVRVVRSNVAAAMQSTHDQRMRGILAKAARVLAEI